MADLKVKLSELPALSAMTNAAVVPVVEGGITKIVTGTALKTYTRTTDVNASELLGTALPSAIVTSSLTSLGTITNLVATTASATDLTVTNPIIRVVPIATRKNSTAQNLLTDVPTRVAFNTAVDAVNSVGITYDGSSNPGRFTNTSGATRVFTLSTTIEFNQTSTAGHRIAWILKNSTERVAQQSQVAATQNGGTGNETTVLNLSVPIVLNNNEFFEVWSYQDSGSTLTIGAGGDFGGSYISIIWN